MSKKNEKFRKGVASSKDAYSDLLNLRKRVDNLDKKTRGRQGKERGEKITKYVMSRTRTEIHQNLSVTDSDNPRYLKRFKSKGGKQFDPDQKRKKAAEKKNIIVKSFLVVPIDSSDTGVRPLQAPIPSYITKNLYLHVDGYPMVTAKNYGNRPLYAALAEFSYFRAGERVESVKRRIIGYSGLPLTIREGSTVTLRCTNKFSQYQFGDVLFASVYDPLFDPPTKLSDPIYDRHCGQIAYPYAGVYEGTYGWPDRRFLIRIEIDVVQTGGVSSYQIKIYEQVNHVLPASPQTDTVLSPETDGFVIHSVFPFKEAQWNIRMKNNNSLYFKLDTHFTDSSGRADQHFEEILPRS
jgi:hypothetical protein